MNAPVCTSLFIAILAACLLSLPAMARGQALALYPTTIEFHVSVGEDGKLHACRLADSGLAAGSLTSFSFSDQNRDRRETGAIPRTMPESGFSEAKVHSFANPHYALAKGRLGPRRGLDDFLEETISAQPAGPALSIVDQTPFALERHDRERAALVLAVYLEGRRLGSEALRPA